jgi:O-antigen ligase
MLRRMLNALCLLLAFTCSMRLWQYQVYIRLQIFDVLLLALIVCYGCRLLVLQHPLYLPAGWRQALIAKWVIVLIGLLTAFQVDSGLGEAAWPQFVKGMVSQTTYALGLTAIVLWLHESRGLDWKAMLRAYATGVAFSSVYSFAEVCSAYFGYDLGKAIFTRLSVFPPDFDLSQPFYYPWENFFRAVGMTGVNAQATYTASMVPLLIAAGPFARRWVNFLLAAICLAGTALTLSRNGFFTLCLCGVFYFLLQPGLAMRLVPKILAALLPILLLFVLFRGPAMQLLGTRVGGSFQELASSRSDIVRLVWPIACDQPWLGHGVNQYSVIISHPYAIDVSDITAKYPTKDDAWVRASYANLHNNWLNWFFEGGVVLVLGHVAGYALLLRLCLYNHTRLGFVSAATLISLLVSGIFNMTLDLFSTELLYIVLPMSVTLAAKSSRSSAPIPAR